MVLKNFFCSVIFFTRPPYFYRSTTGFTPSNDWWTGRCIKLCWHSNYWTNNMVFSQWICDFKMFCLLLMFDDHDHITGTNNVLFMAVYDAIYHTYISINYFKCNKLYL